MKARKNLKELRDSRNLKQKDISKIIGVSTSYYGMIEQGTRTPILEIAKKVSEFFGISIEEIFFDDTNNDKLCKNQVSA